MHGPCHAKRVWMTWHVILSNLHLKSSAKNGTSNWVLIQGGIFTVSICYFWSFITSIMFGDWSGQKSLKLKMDKICRPGPFRMTRLTWLRGDMEFLFSCSTVEHSKRNSISPHVHSLCLLVKVIPLKVCQDSSVSDACFSVGVLSKIVAWS